MYTALYTCHKLIAATVMLLFIRTLYLFNIMFVLMLVETVQLLNIITNPGKMACTAIDNVK